jgi:hypothetical protein
MMNRKQQTNYVLVLSGVAISAILVASLLILSGQFTQKALAQGAAKTNTTNTTSKAASQTGMSAVINAAKNTTATNAATKNIINATSNTTNKTG